MKIIVGVDTTPVAFHAFEEAVRWAKVWSATLETVSVEELPHFTDDIEEIAAVKQFEDTEFRHVVHRVHEAAQREGVTVHSHIVAGSPVKALVRFAEQNGCDLLVIGTSRHGPLAGALGSSTCLGLVHEAPCPVLVVRNKKGATS